MPGTTQDLLDSFARTTDEIVTLAEFKEKLAPAASFASSTAWTSRRRSCISVTASTSG